MDYPFDTHATVKRLIEKGMKEPQAQEIVNIIVESCNYKLDTLATKEDIKKCDANSEKVKTDLLKWYIVTTITGLATLGTFLAYFYN